MKFSGWLLSLFLLVSPFTLLGCGGDDADTDVSNEPDPALEEETNRAADTTEAEVDPAL